MRNEAPAFSKHHRGVVELNLCWCPDSKIVLFEMRPRTQAETAQHRSDWKKKSLGCAVALISTRSFWKLLKSSGSPDIFILTSEIKCFLHQPHHNSGTDVGQSPTAYSFTVCKDLTQQDHNLQSLNYSQWSKECFWEKKKNLWDSIFMIITQQTVIKTVLNYYFLAPARTRQLDGDEKGLEDMRGVFWFFIFLGKKGSHQDVYKTWCAS